MCIRDRSQGGSELVWDSVTDSQLGATGGELLIPTVGQYQLQASVPDASGRVFTSNVESITIEGLLEPCLTVSQYGWTDRAFLVEMTGYDSYPVSWEVTNEQGAVAYRGNLSDDGGNIQIDTPGVYNIQATVTDRLGREFTEQASVEVLPVIELTASADKAGLHLDEKLALNLDTRNTAEDQTITWEVKKDGVVYEGLDLSNLPEISFTEKGAYSFIAKTADKAGREYESEEVSVRVIEDLDLILSADRIDEPDAELLTADALTEMTKLHAVSYTHLDVYKRQTLPTASLLN